MQAAAAAAAAASASGDAKESEAETVDPALAALAAANIADGYMDLDPTRHNGDASATRRAERLSGGSDQSKQSKSDTRARLRRERDEMLRKLAAVDMELNAMDEDE